jgi:hypothetical protein
MRRIGLAVVLRVGWAEGIWRPIWSALRVDILVADRGEAAGAAKSIIVMTTGAVP